MVKKGTKKAPKKKIPKRKPPRKKKPTPPQPQEDTTPPISEESIDEDADLMRRLCRRSIKDAAGDMKAKPPVLPDLKALEVWGSKLTENVALRSRLLTDRENRELTRQKTRKARLM